MSIQLQRGILREKNKTLRLYNVHHKLIWSFKLETAFVIFNSYITKIPTLTEEKVMYYFNLKKVTNDIIGILQIFMLKSKFTGPTLRPK